MANVAHKPRSADDYLKWIIGGSVALVVVILGLFIWSDSKNALQPKAVIGKSPAKSVRELDRNHVTDIGGLTYDSNPPSSGTHFAVWAKRGVYNEILSDGYLIHSLEHGYVVISYNCGTKAPAVSTLTYKRNDPLTKLNERVYAGMQPITPDAEPPVEVKLPQSFTTPQCKQLVNNLSMFLKEYQRVVIAPRINLDTQIALTAWGKIDKMDNFDENRIRAFINEFHNKGPEQTVE